MHTALFTTILIVIIISITTIITSMRIITITTIQLQVHPDLLKLTALTHHPRVTRFEVPCLFGQGH